MLRRSFRDDLAGLSAPARAFLVGSALMGGAQAVSFTFLTRYLNLLDYSKQGIGVVQATDSWGKALIALPAAFVLARRSSRDVFVRAAIVGGSALIVLPMVEGLFAVAAVAFVVGLALAVHYVAIAPFLFRHTTEAERATAFGLAEAVRTAAAVVGAGSAGWIVRALEGPLGGEARATGAVIQIAGGLTLLAAFAYARIQDPEPAVRPTERVLPVVRRHRGVLARFAAPQLLIATGAGFCIPFLPTYFQERFDLDPAHWGSVFAAGQVLMTLGFLSTPFLLSRLGFVRSMVCIELASLPFFLMLAFTGSLPLAIFAFLMRGALMNTTHPISKNLMMEATPAGAREVQTGINATLWGVGWIIGPLAAGTVLDATGNDYRVLMCTTVAMYVVAALMTWLLLRPVEREVHAARERARLAEVAVR